MERDDAIRVMDQLHSAGYACVLRSSNVTEAGGPHFEVGIEIPGFSTMDKLQTVLSIAETNGCNATMIIDSVPQVRAHLVISSPKDRSA